MIPDTNYVSQDTNEPMFPIQRYLSYMVIPGIVLLILIVCLGANYIKGTHSVSIVNGTNEAYSFKLNGETVQLNPGQRLEYDLPYGENHIEPIPGQIAVADQTFKNERMFLFRVFDNRLLIVNPDQVAILMHTTGHFAEHANSAPEDEFEVLAGQALYVFDDIDYEFGPLPNSITTQQTSGVVKKTALEIFPSSSVLQSVMMLSIYGDETETDNYIKQMAAVSPRTPDLPAAAYALLSVDDFHELAGTMLDRRPVMTSWHRIYQEHMEVTNPEFDLTPRYQQMYETYPENGDLAYLYSRQLDDPEERRRLLAIGANAQPPSVWSLYGEAYMHWAEADFDRALERLEQACAMEPGDSTYIATRDTMYLAAGRYQNLIDDSRQSLHQDPSLVEAMVLIQYLIRNGDEREVASEAQFVLQEVSMSMQDGPVEGVDDPMRYTEQQIELAIAMGRGSLEESARLLEQIGDPMDSAFIAMLNGDIDTAHALMLADSDLFWIDDFFSLYIQSIRHNGVDEAQRDRDLLIERLGEGDRHHRRLALWLSGEETPNLDDIIHLPLGETTRPLALVILGFHFPEIKEGCFEMARKQNFSLGITPLLVDDALSE